MSRGRPTTAATHEGARRSTLFGSEISHRRVAIAGGGATAIFVAGGCGSVEVKTVHTTRTSHTPSTTAAVALAISASSATPAFADGSGSGETSREMS
jgi:hypothetical protein